MEKADQLIEDDHAARFAELVNRVSNISKEKLENSHIGWSNHEKVIRYRVVRTAAIVAEMKHRGVEVTEMNAVHLAAILCAAVPTDPAFLFPYHDAFAYEEEVAKRASACLSLSVPLPPNFNVALVDKRGELMRYAALAEKLARSKKLCARYRLQH